MQKIYINKPKIGKRRDILSKITNLTMLLFGFLCLLIDVKSGDYGIVSNIFIFLFYKRMLTKWKFEYLVLVAIVFKIAVYIFFDLDYIAYITTSLFTYPLFILKDIFGKTNPKVLEKNSEGLKFTTDHKTSRDYSGSALSFLP